MLLRFWQRGTGVFEGGDGVFDGVIDGCDGVFDCGDGVFDGCEVVLDGHDGSGLGSRYGRDDKQRMTWHTAWHAMA